MSASLSASILIMAFTPCSSSHTKNQKRHVLDAAFLIDLRPTASVPSHHPDSIEASEVVQGAPTGKFREACVRCPVLIVALDEKPRMEEIRDNLKDRIAEAEREGWLGEVEGLSTSLAAAEDKIAQIQAQQEKKQSPVFLDLPRLSQLTARTSEATK
ncbi:hypothetical protein ACWGEU_22760 [Streptomyces goshikiensis]